MDSRIVEYAANVRRQTQARDVAHQAEARRRWLEPAAWKELELLPSAETQPGGGGNWNFQP